MTEHLTQIFDSDSEAGFLNTPPGMAHWAGTGPERARCFECSYCRTNGRYGPANKVYANSLKPIRCAKFEILTRQNGERFKASTPSCKHFKRADNPAPLVKSFR